MIDLPASMRQRLIDQIDDNFAAIGQGGSDAEFAQGVIEALEVVTEEQADDIGDEIVSHLEASAEMDDTLLETMTDGFANDPEFDYIGEKVMSALERMCKIAWQADVGEGLFDQDEDDY